VATLNGHTKSVKCLLYLNDGTGRLVSGSGDGSLKVWNVSNAGSLITTLLINNEQTIPAQTLELLNDGTLVCGTDWVFVQFWNLTTYTLIKTVYLYVLAKDQFTSLKLLKNGNLASGCEEGTILLWHLAANTQSILQTTILKS
jgi:WD40 repeat protein